MEKQNVSSSKFAWPFKAIGGCTKKMTVGFINLWKYDELQELSESLDKAMGEITKSVEKIKKSAKKYREYCETITACKQTSAHKHAEQNHEDISNEIDCKNKDLKKIDTKAGNISYLRNRIWQNREN